MSCSWTTAQVSSEVADTRAFERTVEVALVEVDVLVEVFDVDVALVVVAAFVVASSSASEVVAAAVETARLAVSAPDGITQCAKRMDHEEGRTQRSMEDPGFRV